LQERYLQKENILNVKISNHVLLLFYIFRAKIYELYKSSYEFDSNNYEEISIFIRTHYNMQSFHIENKKWNNDVIKNVENINNALFPEREVLRKDPEKIENPK